MAGGLLVLQCFALTRYASGNELLVVIENGPVLGVDGGAARSWWGIPFAEPPIGERRWRSPQPLQSNWTDPFLAVKPPPICKQGKGSGIGAGQEDCLYLNVHAPSANSSKLRPVMVWIYGGGYTFGDSYEFGLYNGQHLSSAHELIVVTLNYRLGMFGFAALDSLKEEDADASTGNYALQDQQLALRWVQHNIRSFGGDPNQVTIFGESAGGFSVMWHLVSPTSAGLFSAAIMQSGTNSLSWFFQPYDLATAHWEDQASRLGCPSSLGAAGQRRCLRDLPVDALILGDVVTDAIERDLHIRPKNMPEVRTPLWPLLPWGPVIDGSRNGLFDVPLKLVKEGKFNRVPLLLGANEDGGTIFEPQLPLLVPDAVWPASFSWSGEESKRALQLFFGDNASRVEGMYSEAEYASALFGADARLSRLLRDLVFQCPNRALARAWTNAGLPAYLYVFHFNFGNLDKFLHLGDFHAAELPFVFKNYLWAYKSLGPLQDPYRMSDIMSCNWASFAYSHDPNGGQEESRWPPNCAEIHRSLAGWPKFDPNQAFFYSLKSIPEIQPMLKDNRYPDDLFPREPKCDLLDEISPYLPWINDHGHPSDFSSTATVPSKFWLSSRNLG